LNQDLITYIIGAILLLLAGFSFYCLAEHQGNEIFKDWNEQFKTDEERK
jgi:hypothetical protein